MISANMREYDYYLYDIDNPYGQQTLIQDDFGKPIPQGKVKLSIHNTSTAIQDNISYKGATYIGLTMDKSISDSYVIQYGNERLKVLYINPQGRYNQVFMSSYG